MADVAKFAHLWSMRVNRLVEVVCALLVAALVLDVWAGVVARYLTTAGLTWTEELARYLMIWAALLAVSIGVARREHVAVTFICDMLPKLPRRLLLIGFDLIAFGFFAMLGVYGVPMTEAGATQYTTMFGMTMWLPYAAVPVSCALACLQLVLVALRDYGGEVDDAPEAATYEQGE